MDIIAKISEELGIRKNQAEAAVKLIDEGNTIPFIARYRKEATGALNDEVLRNLYERLTYLRNLEERKETVLAGIEEQGKLTDELKAQIMSAETMVVVEDLYRPYKPKRRTRATIAKEKGLEPLAALLLAAPAMAAEHAPGFEACIKKNPKSSDQKQCLDMERDYWQKKLDTRYQAMQGICKKFSGPEAEKRSTACLEALEESQHSWLAYKASMRPVAENYPNSQSAMENLAWFEIDQLRKRIHDLETLDPSLADKPARRSNTIDDIEKGLSDFGNSMESLFNSGMKKMGLE